MKFALIKNTPGCLKGKLKLIPIEKLLINRNTPVGESPDYYEAKPYDGKKIVYLVGKLTFDEDFKLVEYTDNFGRVVFKK